MRLLLLLSCLLISTSCHLGLEAAAPIISEVMYHPRGTNVLEEWFEVHNASAATLDLSGWKVTGGVAFTFAAGTRLAPDDFLVVSADPAVFRRQHPTVTAVAGGWTGSLADHGDTLELRDTTGAVQTSLIFATEGDWAVRRLGAPDRFGKYGWEWFSLHAGGGRSLELVNERLPLAQGQNWTASLEEGGTPGRRNSAAVVDSAPLITSVGHFPRVLRSGESVRIQARLIDEAPAGCAAFLHWRLDGTATFTTTPMFDDGTHGDGVARDGLYATSLPGQPAGAVIEFYLTASDAAGHVRTCPRVEGASESRSANFVYQVDGEVESVAQPFYRLILTKGERSYLESQVWSGSPLSDAQVNATWVAHELNVSTEGNPEVRYLCSVRNRGHGTRTASPHNMLVQFPDDRAWHGRLGLNLNSQSTPGQALGSAVFRALGVPMAESRLVQLRWSGVNLASANASQWGAYAANEVIDSSLVSRQFPQDHKGSLYRGVRDFDTSITPNLVWHGTDASSYTNAYFKQNHTLENDWTDLVSLLDTLNNSPDDGYVEAVRSQIDVAEWLRYFAVNTLLDNQETCLGTGVGDDFILYFPEHSKAAQVWAYDLDSVLGAGTGTTASKNSIFKAADLAVVSRFLKHPQITRQYHQELRRQVDQLFEPARFAAFVDHWRNLAINSPAMEQVIHNFKTVAAERVSNVRAQSPTSLTVETGLSSVSGIPKATAPTVKLWGFADAAVTARVSVNGSPAVYTAWQGRWTNAAVALQPGINRLVVQAFGVAGTETQRQTVEIWRDDASVATRSGVISGKETWTADGGPYLVNATLTVADGGTLTIQPGTSVFIGANVNLVVANGGRIIAEGSESAPIYVGRAPGATASWGGITINGSAASPETRITHAYIEGNGTTCLHATAGTVFLDHIVFGSADHPYLSLDASSWVVSHCFFPTPTAAFEPVHGTGGIKQGGHGFFLRNFVGAPTGYNDVVDFTGGNRPNQPVAHFLGNVFEGSGDDGLDLDGTDAWVEGNIFLHIHRNGAPDSSAAVSGGNTGNDTSEVTLINNLFYDCDNVVTAKQGNFFTLLNNTMVRTTKEGGVDFASGIVNVRDTTPDVTTPGKGFYLEGNLITDAESLVRNPLDGVPVTFVGNLLPLPWNGLGGNNRTAEADLVHLPTLAETRFTNWQSAQVLWNWLVPSAASPARGTGVGGRNLGASPALGVVVAGAPRGATSVREAVLTVGPSRTGNGIPESGFPQGSGYVAYRWRLDGGAWSAERPISEAIRISGLSAGSHEVEVSGKRDTGVYQDDPLLGDLATLSSSGVWTVDPSLVDPTGIRNLRLSEVLAINTVTLTNGLATPDLIELENTGADALDLSGVALSDSRSAPRKFEFPAGTRLAGGSFLVVFADALTNAPGLHAGFGLKSAGDHLYLFDSNARGGGLLDEVKFGIQVADLSIGRGADGAWKLCHPTPGAANDPAVLAPQGVVVLNEWLAGAGSSDASDFIELYNTHARPAALGGWSLSIAAGLLQQSVIPDLSYIAGKGYCALVADAATDRGADHLAFKLPSDGAVIRMADVDGAVVDRMTYGPQRAGVTEGRSPDGSNLVTALLSPTPGGPNPGVSAGDCQTSVETLPLLGFGATWAYQQTSSLDGARWMAPEFDDSAWASGPGLLALEDCKCLPVPGIQTPLAIGPTTFYFRARFNVDFDPAGVALNLSTILDDGAVIYLNGVEIARPGMPGGVVTHATFSARNVGNAVTEFWSIAAGHLVRGTNVIAAEVHQTSASSTDVTWGASLVASRPQTNCVSLAGSPVRLNEVTARPIAGVVASSSVGWVELHNPSGVSVSLENLSLTDDPSTPSKWRFAHGARIEAGGFLRLDCDPQRPVDALNCGIALPGEGGALFLFATTPGGGAMMDAIRFGPQAAGYSIGRVPDGFGVWALANPSPGATNVMASLGSASGLRLNEWMADPSAGEDWFEVFNTGTKPVPLAGLFFSDALEEPFLSSIPPLSFVGAGQDAWRLWIADGKPSSGATHVNFSLRKSGETLGLFDSSGGLIDGLVFGAQKSGVSEGHYPDGVGPIVRFDSNPTPGSANGQAASVDRDGDGIPNDWEIANGLNPDDPADALRDPDGDGLTNLQEFRAGTDPRNAGSRLTLEWDSGQPMTLRFRGVRGRAYLVETRTEWGGQLGWGRFESIPALAADGDVRIPIPAFELSPGVGARYFRVSIP